MSGTYGFPRLLHQMNAMAAETHLADGRRKGSVSICPIYELLDKKKHLTLADRGLAQSLFAQGGASPHLASSFTCLHCNSDQMSPFPCASTCSSRRGKGYSAAHCTACSAVLPPISGFESTRTGGGGQPPSRHQPQQTHTLSPPPASILS